MINYDLGGFEPWEVANTPTQVLQLTIKAHLLYKEGLIRVNAEDVIKTPDSRLYSDLEYQLAKFKEKDVR